MNELKTVVDELINKINNGVVFFANIRDNNVNFICKSNNEHIKAGLLVKKASEMANGRGGGSSTFAQGGSSDISNIDEVIKVVKKSFKEDD